MPRKPKAEALPAGCYWRGGLIHGRASVAGCKHRVSLRTADPREAGERLAVWIAGLERAAFTVAPGPTFQAAVVRWATEVLPRAVKPQVMRRYLASVAMLDPVFGRLSLAEITPERIAHYISTRAGKVTNATIRRDLTALSRLLSACIAWGWLTENPARSFDRSIIRHKAAPLALPSDAELATVIKAAPEGMRPIIRLLAATGMREAEAVNLAARQIDRERRQIVLTHTKNGRVRRLAWSTPGGDAGPILDALTAADGPLFANRDGDPYRNFATNFGAVIRRVMAREAKAGRPFQRFRAHDLRHRFAVRWLKAGGDLHRLSRHLGHTSVMTTEGYLRHLTDDELDAIDIAERVRRA